MAGRSSSGIALAEKRSGESVNVIVDYGCGNPASIKNMLKKIGYPSIISSDAEDILRAQKLILPGVGSFDRGIDSIHSLGIWDVLSKRVRDDRVPILGICLGYQLFCRKSDEGTRSGLGWINADVVRFDKNRLGDHEKIPHMGWADVQPRGNSALFSGFVETPRFYFVHSYYVQCDNAAEVVAVARHGVEFAAATASGNIVGVQFHPEKSHKFGMTLLANFMKGFLSPQ